MSFGSFYYWRVGNRLKEPSSQAKLQLTTYDTPGSLSSNPHKCLVPKSSCLLLGQANFGACYLPLHPVLGWRWSSLSHATSLWCRRNMSHQLHMWCPFTLWGSTRWLFWNWRFCYTFWFNLWAETTCWQRIQSSMKLRVPRKPCSSSRISTSKTPFKKFALMRLLASIPVL